MPNIIVELKQEIARVRSLFPRFDETMQEMAKGTIRFAETSMAMNSYVLMRESLADLREFRIPDPPAPAEGSK